MKKTGLTTLCLSLTLFVFSASYAYDLTLTNTPAKVYFSPGGGCTEAIVGELNVARAEILVQAYSFTSMPIAHALLGAYKRGVKVCDRVCKG